MAVLHVEMVDHVFSVSGRVHGTKPSAEGVDKRGVVVHPIWEFVGVEECRFEIF